MVTAAIWPVLDYSRVPYRLYHDADIYAREQERIFRGPVWGFLGLDAEIPNPGDFRATYLGETPIIFNRDKTGAVKAFVNRCAHRGAQVRRELSGNAANHICIYQARRQLDGNPVPSRYKGQGRARSELRHGRARSAPAAGRKYQWGAVRHSRRGCRAARRLSRPAGFNTASTAVRPAGPSARLQSSAHPGELETLRREYPRLLSCQPIARVPRHLRARPLDTSGRRQDGRAPSPQHYLGGGRERHRRIRAQAYVGARIRNDFLSLKEPALVAFHPEREDRLNIAITSVFPSAVFVQISNSLAVRQIRPRGVDEVEVFQTMLGYRDDSTEMTLHRLRQANLVGPAGLVSMEDGEAIELAHRASKPDPDRTTVIELGGAGVISDRDYRVTDVPLRGFWSYYAELLGIEPEGAVR